MKNTHCQVAIFGCFSHLETLLQCRIDPGLVRAPLTDIKRIWLQGYRCCRMNGRPSQAVFTFGHRIENPLGLIRLRTGQTTVQDNGWPLPDIKCIFFVLWTYLCRMDIPCLALLCPSLSGWRYLIRLPSRASARMVVGSIEMHGNVVDFVHTQRDMS